MHIGIIGSGHIGGNIGELLARKGHQLYFSYSHDESKLEQLAEKAGNDSKAASPYDAVLCAEVIIFSPPWTTVDDALGKAGDISGKVIIDTTNPYNPDFTLQELPANESSSEIIARKMPSATVVKAFNTLHAERLLSESGKGIAIFYCGDDPVAKQTVAQLIEDCGFAPVDAGTLQEGRLQQPNTDRYERELTKDQAERMVATPH
ncbi:MAG: NAD(P)-binding domain-containing protein [Candidatus Eremiobacteraeota bacterium]|nr:NAD(P)-binding domain-containing protein [Candidatus Eremiobacteraeota bacterium]